MAGTVTIGGFLSGLPFGQINLGPISLAANAGNNLAVTDITLASGANTIAVPSFAVGMVILPNVGNAIAMTLKGITGDTGTPLAPALPSLISFPASPPANIVLTAASLFGTITSIVFF